MKRLRVLLVEDSLTVREHLRQVLNTQPDVDIVGEASDGQQAIRLCQSLRPDVVSMDLMLNGLDGQMATESIMAHCPTPILIVSSSTNRGELLRTYEALAAGAVEVLEKPNGHQPEGDWERRFISMLRLVSRIPVITHVRAKLARTQPCANGATSTASRQKRQLLAIGASTGGPGALADILKALPAPAPLPVLIVMHINAAFSPGFAEWLDGQSPHKVSYAREGESLAQLGGRVLLAPPERHLVVNAGRVNLNADAPRHSCRPSVDVLFESLAQQLGAGVVAALLTGMGRDGALGLLAIRRAGGATLAQDEASSIVYGMPREAALLGAAERVLPLNEMGSALMSLSGVSWELK